jgi:ATP-dependent Lon protease
MADDAKKTEKSEKTEELTKLDTAPVLPLRDIVVFPHMIVPLFVGREKSVRALEEVMNDEKQILLLTQKVAAEDDPTSDGMHTIGTLATVLQLLKLPDQTVRVLVEGKGRARVTGFTDRSDFFQTRRRRGRRRPCCAPSRPTSSNISSSTRRSRPRPWPRSPRSRSRRAWPTRSRRICR